jgi:hypothetical protein
LRSTAGDSKEASERQSRQSGAAIMPSCLLKVSNPDRLMSYFR